MKWEEIKQGFAPRYERYDLSIDDFFDWKLPM
jgi:hypothetical protein